VNVCTNAAAGKVLVRRNSCGDLSQHPSTNIQKFSHKNKYNLDVYCKYVSLTTKSALSLVSMKKNPKKNPKSLQNDN
jgi:hypothetical protein